MLEHANLLNSIESGIVLLDRQMCISRFNKAISSIFKLRLQDIGRPLDHIAYQLSNQDVMLDEVRAVLNNGVPIENEVITPTGKWLLRRIVPNRSETGQLEGVIVMFTDISKVKEAELKVNRLNEELQQANANLQEGRAKLETQNTELKKANHQLRDGNRRAPAGDGRTSEKRTDV